MRYVITISYIQQVGVELLFFFQKNKKMPQNIEN